MSNGSAGMWTQLKTWLFKRIEIEVGNEKRRPQQVAVLLSIPFLFLTTVMIFDALFSTFKFLLVLNYLIKNILPAFKVLVAVKYLGLLAISGTVEGAIFVRLYDFMPGTKLEKSISLIICSIWLLYLVVLLLPNDMNGFLDVGGFGESICNVFKEDLKWIRGARQA